MTNKGYTDYYYESMLLSFPSIIAPENRFVMIFTAYLDESGIDPKAQDIVLAGYLATNDQWKAFEHEWNNAISEFGLSQFHMTDYAAKVKPYNTWTTKQREDRYARLVKIINSNTTCSVGMIMSRVEYAAAMGDIARTMPAGSYGFIFTQLTLFTPVALWSMGNTRPQIAYVLERGAGRHIGDAIHIMDEIAELFDRISLEQNRISPLGYLSAKTEKKERFVPLQAADILAYQLYRFEANYHRSTKYTRRSNHLEMLHTKNSYWVRLDEPKIREAIAFQKER